MKHHSGGFRAERYRFNRAGDVVIDDRTNEPRTSSPARARFKQARAERRANSTPAAAARAIHAAAQKLAAAVIPDSTQDGDL